MVDDSRIEIDPPETPNFERSHPTMIIRQGSGRFWALGCLLSVVAIITIFVIGIGSVGERIFGSGPDPETVASASLEGLREQNTLIPFSAQFVAVVTSTQRRFGLSARKTLIMPGNVRYELDLSALGDDDVEWEAASNTLTVTLPDLRIAGPDIDIDAIREYDDGGILITVTDAESTLDAANRAEGQRSLLRQAQATAPMRLARDAARRAVETNFALPLRAAGIDATVRAQFRNEANPNQMDRSRDVLGEARRSTGE
ncbi:DUF4230 domain-containing protein [Parasphingopyxis lamellibrachiae]|uniref:Uncharacterized protein DUF4230 n=1 Tax=Parasphingopyxis lamellibrachiae TaxID=680125 RepID=A0A3D9FDE1_9SPHN|nr:DUF4230 domain-containing protein [Parasphingopyxis lamellibrachiae]RED15086.1 uncharacterized protein DUF4230 [Parasphingopyxis lamellibrachiae]